MKQWKNKRMKTRLLWRDFDGRYKPNFAYLHKSAQSLIPQLAWANPKTDADFRMAEYIERGPLIEICENQGHVDIDDVLSVEVADVVPVVRCRECKHNDEKKQICALTGVHFLENDFCSYGERH